MHAALPVVAIRLSTCRRTPEARSWESAAPLRPRSSAVQLTLPGREFTHPSHGARLLRSRCSLTRSEASKGCVRGAPGVEREALSDLPHIDTTTIGGFVRLSLRFAGVTVRCHDDVGAILVLTRSGSCEDLRAGTREFVPIDVSHFYQASGREIFDG